MYSPIIRIIKAWHYGGIGPGTVGPNRWRCRLLTLQEGGLFKAYSKEQPSKKKEF